MIISASLSPLSRSVVLAALQTAHRRHAQALGLATPPLRSGAESTLLWDNQPLAALICAAWDQPAAPVLHLLGLPTAASASMPKSGKGGRGAKNALALLQDLPARSERVTGWMRRVFSMKWSQAQLLQVMEEVEPYAIKAWYDEQVLAAAAVASYASLLELLKAKRGDEANAMLLEAVAGLASPDAALAADLATGVDAAVLTERYGHRGDHELELASPRLGEIEGMGGLLPAGATPGRVWRSQELHERRQQAGEAIVAQAGFLQKGSVRSTLALAQQAFSGHATARDNLARMLATMRHWSLAAAHEGAKDGRLDEPNDIFWLELEEIKQMLTGEWHSRDHVQPLIQERRQYNSATPRKPQPAPRQPLGVSGSETRGQAVVVATPAGMADLPANAIALAPDTGPGWSWLFVKAAGVVVAEGDLLCHAAALGRATALPVLVAAGESPAFAAPASPPGGVLTLDPAGHTLKTA